MSTAPAGSCRLGKFGTWQRVMLYGFVGGTRVQLTFGDFPVERALGPPTFPTVVPIVPIVPLFHDFPPLFSFFFFIFCQCPSLRFIFFLSLPAIVKSGPSTSIAVIPNMCNGGILHRVWCTEVLAPRYPRLCERKTLELTASPAENILYVCSFPCLSTISVAKKLDQAASML